MQLSDRLNAVLDLINPCECIADVGCDHGFISIELINREIAERVIATDVRPGPLSRAEEHIEQWNLQNKIQTRLSDGVCNLEEGEAQAVVIAGMGGNLVIHILEDGMNKILQMEQCILQPQSEIEKVRRFLRENNLKIVAENMICEDGKYYPMMRAVPSFADRMCSEDCEQKVSRNSADCMEKVSKNSEDCAQEVSRNSSDCAEKVSRNSADCMEEGTQKIYDCYGEFLLKEKNPVLKQFLLKKLATNEAIYSNLINNTGADVNSGDIISEINGDYKHSNRIKELLEEKKLINLALEYF